MSVALPAQDPPEKPEPPAKKEEKELTPRQKKIAELFHATKVEFTDEGHIVLEYDFQSENEILLEDFAPKISTTKNRIRWAIRNETGLMIAMHGNWVHNAEFRGTVKAEVKGVSYAMMDGGDYRVVGLFGSKGKKMIGSNVGKQLVRLTGMKLRDAMPRTFPETRVEEKLDFGFALEKGVLFNVRGGREKESTTEKPKFTKGFEVGRIGLRWQGRTQMCIHTVRIQGKLDPKWLDKQIGKAPKKE
ncbi:MAG: hypothetical protein AAF488_08990 [Planctomycetota bacterium]